MITYTQSNYDIDGERKISGECLSTDTKPTNVLNGSMLIEMDSGKVYAFDKQNSIWRDITQ